MPVAAWCRNSQTMSRRTRNADMHARRTTYTAHATAQVRKYAPRWRCHSSVAGDGEHRRDHRLEAERAALDERAVEAVHEPGRGLLQRHARSPGGSRRARVRAASLEVGARGAPAHGHAHGVVQCLLPWCRRWRPRHGRLREGRRADGLDERRRRARTGNDRRIGRGAVPSRTEISAAGRGTMRYASTASTRRRPRLSSSMSVVRPPGVVSTSTRRPAQSSHATSVAHNASAPGDPAVSGDRSRPGRPAPSPWPVPPQPFGRRPASRVGAPADRRPSTARALAQMTQS